MHDREYCFWLHLIILFLLYNQASVDIYQESGEVGWILLGGTGTGIVS